MKNRIKHIRWFYPFFLAVAAIIFSISASAYEETYLDYSFIGNNCVVIGCDVDAKGAVTVPETVAGKTVVQIADDAFSGCKFITEINIPETVRTIGNRAFSACVSLEAFDMPDSVENIGKSVFSECYALKSVNLSQSVNLVPEETFYMCKSLRRVEISDDTTLFGKNAFKSCLSLRSMILPPKLRELFSGCFSGCAALEKIYIPASVHQIGKDVFEKCTALKAVYYQSSEADFSDVSILSGNEMLLPDCLFFNHNHRQSSTVTTVGSTCLQDGYKIYDCVCGYSETGDYVTAKGHELTEYLQIYESDCVNKGLAYLKCKNCAFYEEIILPLRQHTPAKDAAVKPTCIKTGLTEGSHCSVCGKILTAQKKVPVTSHTYTKKITDNAHKASAATYTVSARYYYSCAVCNAVSKDKTYNGSKLILGKTNKFISASTADSITLGWNKVKDASGYNVYYKNAAGNWKLYRTITDNIIKISKLPAGRVYEFAVRAYVLEKGKTVLAPEYVTLKEATKPTAPAKITAKQNEKAIQLNWSASAGATHYQVYYYNTAKKAWVLLKDGITACKYTVNNVKNGVAIKFAVRPYISIGAKKVIGSSYIAITTSTKTLAPVLKSTALKGGVRLNWNNVNGADGYIIYGSSKPNTGYSRLAVTTALTYTKSGLTSGKTYYFVAYSYKNTPSGIVYSYAGAVKPVTTR